MAELLDHDPPACAASVDLCAGTYRIAGRVTRIEFPIPARGQSWERATGGLVAEVIGQVLPLGVGVAVSPLRALERSSLPDRLAGGDFPRWRHRRSSSALCTAADRRSAVEAPRERQGHVGDVEMDAMMDGFTPSKVLIAGANIRGFRILLAAIQMSHYRRIRERCVHYCCSRSRPAFLTSGSVRDSLRLMIQRLDHLCSKVSNAPRLTTDKNLTGEAQPPKAP